MKKIIILISILAISVLVILIPKNNKEAKRPSNYDKYKNDVKYLAIVSKENNKKKSTHKYKYYDKNYKFLYEESFKINPGNIDGNYIDSEYIYRYGKGSGLYLTSLTDFSTDYYNTESIDLIKKIDDNIYYVSYFEGSSSFCTLGDKCFITDMILTDFNIFNGNLYLSGIKDDKTILHISNNSYEVKNEEVSNKKLNSYFIRRNKEVYLISNKELINTQNNSRKNINLNINPITFNKDGLEYFENNEIQFINNNLEIENLENNSQNYRYYQKNGKSFSYRIDRNKVIFNNEELKVKLKYNEVIKSFYKL